MTNTETPQFLTTEEVAELLRVSPATVRGWKHKRLGPPSMQIVGRVLYRRDDLHTWLEQQSAPAATA